MRRTLIILALTLMGTQAYAATVSLGCPAVPVPPAQRVFDVPVIVTTADPLGAYAIILDYAPRDFEVVDIAAGPDPLFAAGFLVYRNDPGELKLVGFLNGELDGPT